MPALKGVCFSIVIFVATWILYAHCTANSPDVRENIISHVNMKHKYRNYILTTTMDRSMGHCEWCSFKLSSYVQKTSFRQLVQVWNHSQIWVSIAFKIIFIEQFIQLLAIRSCSNSMYLSSFFRDFFSRSNKQKTKKRDWIRQTRDQIVFWTRFNLTLFYGIFWTVECWKVSKNNRSFRTAESLNKITARNKRDCSWFSFLLFPSCYRYFGFFGV